MAMAELTEGLRTPTTVVVPLDGSAFAERALPFAVETADRFGARIILVGSRTDHGDLEETRRYLRSMAVGHGHAEAECLVVADREPAPVVSIVAGEGRGALIVMASHGRGPVGHLVLGSVTEELLAHHVGPVLVVGPRVARDLGARAASGPVLLGIDEDETDDDRIAMAAACAATRHRGLELVSVVVPGGARNPTPAEHARVAARVVALTGVTGLPVTTHFIEHHDRAHELAARADAVDACLIVIGTRSPTGVERVVGGNVAMRTVHLARCPVLVVSPARIPAGAGGAAHVGGGR